MSIQNMYIYLWKDLWGFGNRSPAGAQLPPPISGASAKSKNAERPNVGAKNIIGLLPWDRLFGGPYSGLKMFIQEFQAKPLHVCDHFAHLKKVLTGIPDNKVPEVERPWRPSHLHAILQHVDQPVATHRSLLKVVLRRLSLRNGLAITSSEFVRIQDLVPGDCFKVSRVR